MPGRATHCVAQRPPARGRRPAPGQRVVGVPMEITLSCYRRLELFGTAAVRDAFAQHLEQRRSLGDFRLHAWMVMPNHVHVVFSLVQDGPTCDEMQNQLQLPFAQATLMRWRNMGASVVMQLGEDQGETLHFWQRVGGPAEPLVLNNIARDRMDYIHRDPVREGLVREDAMWAWSSAAYYESGAQGLVRIDPLADDRPSPA